MIADRCTSELPSAPRPSGSLVLIKNPKVFRFCAIPQVMAMATLAKIYNNPHVYTEVVKIRKGIAATLMLHTNDIQSVHVVLEKFTNDILKKINSEDPNYNQTKEKCHYILSLLHKHQYQSKTIANIPIEKTVLF